MFFFNPTKSQMPTPEDALPGREEPIRVNPIHAVLGSSTVGPWDAAETVMVGMGCFWGAERKFWTVPGVLSTQVGYAAGYTPHPTYEEVCSGRTGHNEVVRIVYDPSQVTIETLLAVFWESHNPTQGMRQGNDVGTQYRSGVYFSNEEQKRAAESTKATFQARLQEAGFGAVTTEILPAGPFFYAEDYHQQYLHKNPGGYCGLGGTGVTCPS